ncbi:hypothetical protein PIB30_055119 [Stylosanthes scabra]|uniref:Uncharacterized protein n=1 Tax=Stylosanthes scabra TaxID=79078 RepID=A0ABU6VHV8_9FABA|nr:hypothetical protein [Stylosanthes scabra]
MVPVSSVVLSYLEQNHGSSVPACIESSVVDDSALYLLNVIVNSASGGDVSAHPIEGAFAEPFGTDVASELDFDVADLVESNEEYVVVDAIEAADAEENVNIGPVNDGLELGNGAKDAPELRDGAKVSTELVFVIELNQTEDRFPIFSVELADLNIDCNAMPCLVQFWMSAFEV